VVDSRVAIMEEFLPLVPVQVTLLTLEERMVKMEVEFKKELKETKEELVTHRKPLLPFCEREFLILVGEILKWAVKKQGVEDGNRLHLFNPSVEAVVLGNRLQFKKM